MKAPAADIAEAVQASAPDAELLTVCAEFNRCDRQQRAIYSGPDRIEDDDACTAATAPIFARMKALADRMEQLRAVTSDGVAARAGCLAQHAGHWGYSFDSRESIAGRLLDYLMRDAAALEGVGVASCASPDAALIALCATFHRQHAEAYDEANLDWEAAAAAKHSTFVEIGGLTATTDAGHRAKAVVAVILLAENINPDGSIVDPEAAFTLNLLRDWLGRG